MKLVQKKDRNKVKAYRLGDDHIVIRELMEKGLLKKMEAPFWRVISQEATEGEVARDGDYIKIDSKGYPYPNEKHFFENNHKKIGGDEYEQIPKPLLAWNIEEPECAEIQFLKEYKGLVINSENEEAYYKAPLWGDVLTAAKDAEIVFYHVSYNEHKQVLDADFNFVARDEFDHTYDVLDTCL